MARSLDDLVDFVLDEIALNGDRGASLQDLVRYTEQFYAQPYDDQSEPLPSTISSITTCIDRNFIIQLWKWLSRNSELRFGRNDEYRSVGLDQIEIDFPNVLTGLFDTQGHTAQPADDSTPADTARITTNGASHDKDVSPRIFASQKRIYHTLCGHDFDPSRVSDLEFALLRTIGAARHDGILQGELGRITRQDKRSVPKRTDSLQDRGYIEKIPAYNGGHKTSRIVLRRFVNAQPELGTTSLLPRLRDLANQIFTVLKTSSSTSQDDLATALRISEPAKRHVLDRVIQHLVNKKCLEQIEAADVSDKSKNQVPKLRVTETFDDASLDKSDDDFLDLDNQLESAIASAEKTVGLLDHGNNGDDTETHAAELLALPTAGRPGWNPDRALPNIIHDLAVNNGEDGITNLSVRQQITGMNVKRSVESLLTRLSHSDSTIQSSNIQPPALIRTSEVKDGLRQYVHRSFETFREMVRRNGSCSDTTRPDSEIATYTSRGTGSIFPDLQGSDDLAFAKNSTSQQAINEGSATNEGIASLSDSSATMTSGPRETSVAKDRIEATILSSRAGSPKNELLQGSATPRPLSYIVTLKLRPGYQVETITASKRHGSTVPKPTGRPRKFLQGTAKFWQYMFGVRKLEIDPTYKRRQYNLVDDPDCYQLYSSRPENFDDILLTALNKGIPVPHNSAGINQEWMDKVQSFLNRDRLGVFYVPSGISDLQEMHVSCPVVIRSDRLSEIKVPIKLNYAPVFFLSSSAAHSFRYYGGISQSDNLVKNDLKRKAFAIADPTEILDEAHTSAEHSKELRHGLVTKRPRMLQRTGSTLDNHDRLVTDPASSSSPPRISFPAPKSSKEWPSSSSRTQRQRRPTRKAIESAQTYVPDETDMEMVDAGLLGVQNPLMASDGRRRTISQSSQYSAPTNRSRLPNLPIDSSAEHVANHSTLDQVLHAHRANKEQSFGMTHEVADASDVPSEQFRGERILENDQSGKDQELDLGSRRSSDFGSGTPVTEYAASEPSLEHTNIVKGSSRLRLLVGRDAMPYYKKFLIELVHLCGGVVPHDPSLLKRAMGPKTVEAHVESNMNVKLIKSAINALTQSGKLKIMQFAYQRNGFNHTKAILALPETQPDNQFFTAMQTRISLLPANIDYVPPELEMEAARTPQGILRTADSPGPDPKVTPRRVIPPRPKRARRSSISSSRRSSFDVDSQSTPSTELDTSSLNTGFLTLKVPNIARIQTDQLFTSRYFELPAQPLVVNATARSDDLDTASSTPRQNGTRKFGRNSGGSAARRVQWRIPRRTPLPKSLRAILAYDDRPRETDLSLSINPALEIFDREVDFVEMWEHQHFDDLQESKPQEWNFVNHIIYRRELVRSRQHEELHFRSVSFNDMYEEVEEDMPEAESWEVFAEIVAKEASKKKATTKKSKRKIKAQDEFIDDQSDRSGEEDEGLSDFASSGEEAPTRKRQRGGNHKYRRKPRIAGTELDKRRQRRPHTNPRGIGLRDTPKDLAHRITTAIVVVRVLGGGLDKYLDWKLVARLLPDEPEGMLQSRWRTLSTRYNNDFDAMVQDLQIKYLDALADDKVPSVDYDDLPGTNWEGIFEWAVANINADDKGLSVTEIPPTREEFLELYAVSVSEPTSVRSLHNSSLQYTQITKEDFWCSVIPGISAESLPAAERAIVPIYPVEEDQADILLARARSWVFAAVLTPHRSFDPQKTHEKLRKLAEDKRQCERLIEVTIRKLQNDKMVVTKDSADAIVETDGTTLSGTYEWKLSTRFLDRFELNRYINFTMLKQAVKYKIEVLDAMFARGEVVVIPGDPYLDDGVMVAIFNLMNMGMLSLEAGSDMPQTRYGIDDESGGYKTRSMDKKNLYFSTVLCPGPSYVYGDLSAADKRHIGIPRGDIDQEDGLGLIPVWFDINHAFRADIWDMVVGAVVGLISSRPGVSILELVRTLAYVLSQKDMAMVVQYLHDCKMVEKTCTGWETTETWWFAIGMGTISAVEDGV